MAIEVRKAGEPGSITGDEARERIDALQVVEATNAECPVGWWLQNGSRRGLVVNESANALKVRWMQGKERDQLSPYPEQLLLRHLHGDAVFARSLAELDERFDALDEDELRGSETFGQMAAMFRKLAESTDVDRMCAFFENMTAQCVRVGAIAERARAIQAEQGGE